MPLLSLAEYRTAVDLDEPFVRAAAAAPSRLPGLVAEVTAYLEGDGGGAVLRAELGDDLPRAPAERLGALLTVRRPGPLPSPIAEKLDAVLSARREARPTVAGAALPTFDLDHGARTALALWQGDITTLAVDAVVNAANSALLGCFRPNHPCIDNAIHAAAGPRLREDCGRIMELQAEPEPTGTAKATRAYHLPSRFVLHTVGPIVRGAVTDGHEATLGRCYRSCLDLAARLPGVRSVSLCAISTGLFGFPREPAARIALETVRRWLDEHPDVLDLVVFDVFGAADLTAYRSALSQSGVRS